VLTKELIMNYNRLFTFGCSYTEYQWATWADIINFNLGIEFHNMGLSGIGNIAIFHKMLETDIKYKFSDNDLILVNWSSWTREDRIFNGAWGRYGNIFFNQMFNRKFVVKFWNQDNDIVKNTTAIISANRRFGINFQSHMVDYQNSQEYNTINTVENDSLSLYDFSNHEYLMNELPDKIVFDISDNSRFNLKVTDTHPDILCQLRHAQTVCQNLGLVLSSDTVQHYQRMQQRIIQALPSGESDLKNVFNIFKHEK